MKFQYQKNIIFKRCIKYIVLVLCIGIIVSIIPISQLDIKDKIIISLSTGMIFSIIDTISPSYNLYLKDNGNQYEFISIT